MFFLVNLQTSCLRGFIVTVAAFVYLSLLYVLSNVSSNYLPEGMHNYMLQLQLFDFSPMCVFKCALKLPAVEDT